jgi:hypothetical protein
MGIWASLGVTERVTMALTNGTGLAIVGTCLLLLGHLVSIRLRPKFWQFSYLKPRAFHASVIAVTAFCWVGAVLAFASGL